MTGTTDGIDFKHQEFKLKRWRLLGRLLGFSTTLLFVSLAGRALSLEAALGDRSMPIAQASDSSNSPTAFPESGGITDKMISDTELTIPSLWWIRDQFGVKVVSSWVAYPSDRSTPSRVDLVVNRQLWSLLDYVDRYEFVNHFGVAARDFGYNLRVLDRPNTGLGCDGTGDRNRPECPIELAAYVCQRSATVSSRPQPKDAKPVVPSGVEVTDAQAVAPTCKVTLNSSGRNGFGGRSLNSNGGFSPTGNGIDQP